MNTKLFNSFAAAAMSVLALACAKEPVGGGIEASTVSFTVEVPETTVTTKGISDASTTDELICQVFLNDGNYTPVPELTQKVPVDVASHKAKVEFSLVKGNKYAFIFWAQASGTGFYETSDLRSVKMNVNNVKANEPKMDAFWATATKTATANPSDESITLLRALAQVNFGAVLPAQGRVDAVTVTKSTISMTGVPHTFHPFLGNKPTACEGSVDITFAENATIDENLRVAGVDYSYLATAFVFTPKSDQKLTDVKATFTISTGKTTSVSAPNVPIQGNYRTNILGDLLTVGATFNVKIDSEFKGGDKTYDAVSASLEKGATVTLSDNYTVAAASTGVSVPLGATSVLNLNGKNFSNVNGKTGNKAALQVHGNLTINGNGEVYCEGGATNNAIIVEQGGHLVINGGTYNVGKAANGTSNATIYVQGPDTYGRNGSVEIYGGTFKAEAGTDGTPFVLNQSDDITIACFTVYGGTFIGFNPANVNEAHGAITSFVAPGYKSVKVSDTPETWEVQDAAIKATTQDDFKAALNAAISGNDVTIKLAAGTFNWPDSKSDAGLSFPKTINIVGTSKDNSFVKFNAGSYPEDCDVNLENVTIENAVGCDYNEFDLAQMVRVKDVNVTNCIIKNQFRILAKGVVTIKDCKFVNGNSSGFDGYCLNYYGYNGSKVIVNNCSFETVQKAIVIYSEGDSKAKVYDLEVSDCVFTASDSTTGKAAIQMHTEYGIKGVLNISNCSATGFKSNSLSPEGLWWEGNNGTKQATKNFTITVDGTTVQTAE